MRKLAILIALLAAGVASAVQIAGSLGFGGSIPSVAASLLHDRSSMVAAEAARAHTLETALTALRADLVRSPLEDYPLALAGTEFVKQGDTTRTQQAVQSVLERNPRSRWGRAVAVVMAMRSQPPRPAIEDLSVLIALDPQNQDTYVKALTEVSRLGAAQPLLEAMLATKPPWRDAFLSTLETQRPNDPFAKRLAPLTPAGQEAALRHTVAQSGYELAFLDWLTFLPTPPRRLQWPYDGEFKGMPGGPPFNWRLNAGGTERLQSGGLYAKFFGRNSEEFAQESMLLGPGRYELIAEMSGETSPRGGYFRWDLRCADGVPLVALDVDQLEQRPKRWRTRFSIPADACAAQTLSFWGVAGELPLWGRTTVSRIAVEPAAVAKP